MKLWNKWMVLVNAFETAFSRKTSYFWFVTILIGFTIKSDFLGVTGIARGVGLLPTCYTSMLNFFSSTAVDLDKIKDIWIALVLEHFTGLVRVNGRYVLVGDGIKVAKEGKHMPGVKCLHQDSESNSKAEYIMGHSMQVVSILVKGLSTFFAIPLTGGIHEGIRFSCRDNRTLLDKMCELLMGLKLTEAFYFVADKYYCSGPFMKKLFDQQIYLVTMMKKSAVAYFPLIAKKQKGKGRPPKYGKKIKLFDLFKLNLPFIAVPYPNNEKLIIEYFSKQLFWKPLGRLALFVFVRHPQKGLSIVMSTDVNSNPLDLIFIYSLRFKIEVLFKQAVHQIGAFMYRFWLKVMSPTKRGGGDKLIHFASSDFKNKVAQKLNAYHLFMQLGLIAQGLLQYLSLHYHKTVWQCFGTWLRTIRKELVPSEMVVALSLKKTYVEFLIDRGKQCIFKKFLGEKVDLGQLRSSYVDKKEAA